MVDFNEEGLSDVANFFGVDVNASKSAQDDSLISNKLTKSQISKKKKLGVGASFQVDENEPKLKDGLGARKLLRIVDRSKRNINEEDDGWPSHDQEQSEEEEEEGRTSAIPKSTRLKRPFQSVEGMKEVERKSPVQSSKSEKVTGNVSNENQKTQESKHSTKLDIPASLNEAPNQSNVSDLDNFSGKRRRTKKRSRQKNIRKDKRGQNKPSHLIIGSSDYCGRPLTQETKKYLKLAPKAGVPSPFESDVLDTIDEITDK